MNLAYKILKNVTISNHELWKCLFIQRDALLLNSFIFILLIVYLLNKYTIINYYEKIAL